MEYLTPALREWCISHLMNRALIDTFGAQLDRTKCTNKRAREVFDACRKVVEKVHKSEPLAAAFEEEVRSEFGRFFKLLNSPAHRWSSMEDVLSRLLKLWEPLNSAFAKHEVTLPIATHQNIMLEFYSMLHHCRKVQRQAQKMHSFVGIEVFLDLVNLYSTVLQPSECLEIVNPAKRVALVFPFNTRARDSTEDINKRQPNELDTRTTYARSLMREAMNKRFYNRYDQSSPIGLLC